MLSEQIKIHENFGSQHLGVPRNVLVYLPPGYGLDESKRYPVFYMHDGQNLINPQESFGGVVWGVDETAQELILTEQVEPLIIVGIYNTGDKRIDEYTPVKSAGGRMRGRGGNADQYGRMIIEELKPFIDREYLTKPEAEHTALGGSSLGGLVSLHLGIKRPDVFSRLAVMSPAVWWGEQSNYPRSRADRRTSAAENLARHRAQRRFAHQTSSSRSERNPTRQRLAERC